MGRRMVAAGVIRSGQLAAYAEPAVVEVAGWCLTTAQLREMRAWAAECPWGDYEPDDVRNPDVVPDDVVVQGVERHYRYVGSVDGVAGFLLDGGMTRAEVEVLRAAHAWEVDDAAGNVVYRGTDLELAHELMGPGAHLIPLCAADFSPADVSQAAPAGQEVAS